MLENAFFHSNLSRGSDNHKNFENNQKILGMKVSPRAAGLLFSFKYSRTRFEVCLGRLLVQIIPHLNSVVHAWHANKYSLMNFLVRDSYQNY